MPSLVSAVIPTYDRPDRTARAIESVFDQTYEPVELIVVDDGSKPPIRNKIQLHRNELEGITFMRHDENRGANIARNTGICRAEGDYVAFLDSDDEWSPTKIQRQVDQLQNERFQASYTAIQQVDEAGKVNAVSSAEKSGDISTSLRKYNHIGSFSCLCVEHDAIQEVGSPDPGLPCWQDWEWYLRLSKHVEFGAINNPLTVRHNEGDQISSSFEPKRDVAFPVIRDRVRELASTDREAEIAEAYVTYHLGYAALTSHRFSAARRLLTRAIRLHPREPWFYKYLACAGPHYEPLRSIKRQVVRSRR